MKPQRLYVALDVDFLIALADGADSALATIDTITTIRGFPIASPSVIQELEWIAQGNVDARSAHLAKIALGQMTNWGVLCPPLDPVNHAVVGIIALRIVTAGMCTSFQGATVLVEASSLNCPILMTYVDHMLAIDGGELKLIMLGADLPCDCWPIDPVLFVDHFKAATPAPSGPASVSASA